MGNTGLFKLLRREKKSFKSLFRKFLDLNDTPERIALSFSIGVFIAFSPLLGTHLITVFLIILFFRLNKVAILTGALINNPWTIIPMYTAGTFLGFFLMGKSISRLPAFSISDLLSFNEFFHKFKAILFPYLLGCTVLGLIAAVIAYFLMKRLFNEKAAQRARNHNRSTNTIKKVRFRLTKIAR